MSLVARRGLAGRIAECPLVNIADLERPFRNDGSRPEADVVTRRNGLTVAGG
jgi:hypothetical protein